MYETILLFVLSDIEQSKDSNGLANKSDINNVTTSSTAL